MTPPTPEQVAALEQWARETAKAQPYTVWASRADAILALIASWREGQQEKTALYAEFRKMVDTSMSCLDERDAAIARAAHAEQERDEADTALAACQSQSSGIIARLTDERDKAIDMVADIGKPLGQLSMPQIHCNADVVKALRQRELEAKAERDAARAEAAALRATVDALTNGQLGQMRAEAQQ